MKCLDHYRCVPLFPWKTDIDVPRSHSRPSNTCFAILAQPSLITSNVRTYDNHTSIELTDANVAHNLRRMYCSPHRLQKHRLNEEPRPKLPQTYDQCVLRLEIYGSECFLHFNVSPLSLRFFLRSRNPSSRFVANLYVNPLSCQLWYAKPSSSIVADVGLRTSSQLRHRGKLYKCLLQDWAVKSIAAGVDS